jgi:hypothetical protein
LEIELKLLIHADPGARGGFVAAWLLGQLTTTEFDVGSSIGPKFVKIHRLENTNDVNQYNGLKIRISPNIETIDLHCLLFLRKNVYIQIPTFTRDEYSLETFTKLTHFSQEIFEWDKDLDYSLYNIVLNFADTFDTDFMIKLYRNVNSCDPSPSMIDNLIKTNKLNSICIDKNHACSILKLCLEREQKLNLNEKNRFWSIVDIYNTIPADQLYDTVYDAISPKNYGIHLT